MTISELFIYYLKYYEEINSHYDYALKEGYVFNDDADWMERTAYFKMCQAYD